MFAMNEFLRGNAMHRKFFATVSVAIALAAMAAGGAAAQDTIKIGLVLPMTGTVGAAGQEVAAAVKL